MTATLGLALVLAMGPMSAGAMETEGIYGSRASTCTPWRSWRVPPDTIRVFRIHRRGSSTPARVETWPFRRYVAAVMASGAWPSRVRESAKVGAIAIKGWALWMIRHHQAGYSWHGACYDVRDGDQYLRPSVRPWTPVPARAAAVVRITWPITLTKNGHHFRTGWSGGQGDAWHLGEDEVRAMAERGAGWRTIVSRLLAPVRIVGDWR